ncbi:MAG: hypothetical protein AAFY53_13455, partial [Pseudomonadota bacterium]
VSGCGRAADGVFIRPNCCFQDHRRKLIRPTCCFEKTGGLLGIVSALGALLVGHTKIENAV